MAPRDRPAAALALAAVAILAVVLLAGCSSARCRPAVEVRNCGANEHCSAGLGERTLDWNPDAGKLWPPVERLIEGTAAGENATSTWTADQQRAFWAFWDVPAEQPGKHLFFLHEGETFLVTDRPC